MTVDRMWVRIRLAWRRWRSRLRCPPRTAFAVPDWNFQPPVTPIAQEIYDLHTCIFWICVVIFVGVFGVMFYSIFKHRKSVGHQAAQFHENTTVEIIWTVIPFLILMFMALAGDQDDRRDEGHVRRPT